MLNTSQHCILVAKKVKGVLSCTRQNRLREVIPSFSSALMRTLLEFWPPPHNKYINLKERE